jgi:mannitol-1-phosphate/altronate dehydrogenase
MEQLGLKTILLANPNSKKRNVYDILRAKRGYQIEEFDTGERRSISDINLIFLDEPEATSSIADPEVVLLTTAVTPPSLSAVAPIIAKGLSVRVESEIKTPLFVIACENLPQNSQQLEIEVNKYLSQEIRQRCKENTTFLNTVVDRVCLEPKVIEDRVVVPVESWTEWIVEIPKGVSQPNFLGTPITVAKGTNEFNFFEMRKTWLINGTHLVTSIYGYVNTIVELKEVFKNPSLLNKIMLIQEGFTMALNYLAKNTLRLNEKDLPEIAVPNLRRYATKMLDRIERSPDTVDRILRDLLQLRDAKLEVERYIEQCRAAITSEPVRKNIKKILQLTDMHPFFVKSYGRICNPLWHLLQFNEDLNGVIFSRRPDITAALLECFIYTYYVIEKEFQRYSRMIAELSI